MPDIVRRWIESLGMLHPGSVDIYGSLHLSPTDVSNPGRGYKDVSVGHPFLGIHYQVGNAPVLGVREQVGT